MYRNPAQIGKYKIVSQLAQGGMGAVFKAEHPTLARFVVLKKLSLHGNASIIERFRREAQIMMDFRNEYIVDVYDHFKEGPFYYIVQEYVDGMSLDRLIERERYLPNDVALLVYLDCARALKYAHDRNVIHRDIKPQNILISNDGKTKLTDFGIAASQEFDEDGLTKEGMMMGTPSYISPEQIQDTRTVDKRADIYSLGVTLYEMVTGKTPYPGNFSPDTVARIQKGKYRRPHKINPRVSPLVRKIIARSMTPRRTGRFQDLGDPIRLIERYLSHKEQTSAGDLVKRYVTGEVVSALPEKRHRKFRAAAVAVILALAVLAGAGRYLHRSGLLYEYLYPERYGLISLAVELPAGTKTPEELFVKATLVRTDLEAPLEAEIPGFEPVPSGSPDSGSPVRFVTPAWHLPSGSYRLTVEAENGRYIESFYLGPRVIQRDSPLTRDGLTVEARIAPMEPVPVRFTWSVTNRNTGFDITAESSLWIELDGRWVPWDPFFAEYLRSGSVYRFRVTRERFYPAEYEAALSVFQTDLELAAALVPHPGYVRISANAPGIELLLNNRSMYLSGGRARELRRLEPTGTAPQVIELPPGTYILTARSSRFITRDIRVTVQSGVITEVSIAYNRETDTIELKAGE